MKQAVCSDIKEDKHMKRKYLKGMIAIITAMLIAGLAVGCGSTGKSDGIVTGSQTDDDEFKKTSE